MIHNSIEGFPRLQVFLKQRAGSQFVEKAIEQENGGSPARDLLGGNPIQGADIRAICILMLLAKYMGPERAILIKGVPTVVFKGKHGQSNWVNSLGSSNANARNPTALRNYFEKMDIVYTNRGTSHNQPEGLGEGGEPPSAGFRLVRLKLENIQFFGKNSSGKSEPLEDDNLILAAKGLEEYLNNAKGKRRWIPIIAELLKAFSSKGFGHQKGKLSADNNKRKKRNSAFLELEKWDFVPPIVDEHRRGTWFILIDHESDLDDWYPALTEAVLHKGSKINIGKFLQFDEMFSEQGIAEWKKAKNKIASRIFAGLHNKVLRSEGCIEFFLRTRSINKTCVLFVPEILACNERPEKPAPRGTWCYLDMHFVWPNKLLLRAPDVFLNYLFRQIACYTGAPNGTHSALTQSFEEDMKKPIPFYKLSSNPDPS